MAPRGTKGLSPSKAKPVKPRGAKASDSEPWLFEDAKPKAPKPMVALIDLGWDEPKPVIYPDMQPQKTIQCGPLCPWIYYPVPSPNSYHLPAGCPQCAAVHPSLCIVDDGGFCWLHGKEHVSALDLMDEMFEGLL